MLISLAIVSSASLAADRPNVLLLVVDDLNMRLGAYGDPIAVTPNIDRLAADGVRFDRAYCQAPICNASRTSFLSGRRPETTGVHDNNTAPRKHLGAVRFLPDHFREHGYHTVRVGKVAHNTYESAIWWDVARSQPIFSGESVEYFNERWQRGEAERAQTDRVFNQLLAPFEHRMGGLFTVAHTLQPGLIPEGWGLRQLMWHMATVQIHATEGADDEEVDGQTAAEIARRLEEAASDPSKPFFIAAGFYRPHLPWVAPKKYFDLYPLESIVLPANATDPADSRGFPEEALSPHARLESNPKTPDEARRAIQAYLAAVSYVDSRIGVVLDALERSKQADRTIVILLSDHGYHLGEHGFWHKLSLFEESTRVPLIVRPAGNQTTGQVRGVGVATGLVELVDIYPTLVELAGLPIPEGLEGTSFAPLLAEPTRPWKSAAFTCVRRVLSGEEGEPYLGRSVRTERHRYTEWGSPDVVELYDLVADPAETRNLANEPSHAGLRFELQSRLRDGWRAITPRRDVQLAFGGGE